MLQVKVFSASTAGAVEEKANVWIQNSGHYVNDFKIATCFLGDEVWYTLAVSYFLEEPEAEATTDQS